MISRYFKSDISKIFSLFIIWRLFLFLVAYLSPIFLPIFGARFPYFKERLIATGLPHFIWSFGNFDGVHYLGIAKDGYAYQFTQAFFPLYPILIKIMSLFTFGNFVIAGLLISNTAFLVGILLFYKMVSKVYSKKIAFWSVLFLLTFPTSFYFGSVYTEGLFFLMIIAAFYLLEKNRIFWASLVGIFASATRLVGIFLAPSLIKNRNIRSLFPLLIVPLGLAFYMIYLAVEFKNPLYFLTAQDIWGQERSTAQIVLLPQVFWRYLKILLTTQGLPFLNAAFELGMTIFSVVILIFAVKYSKKEWLIFSALAILTPTLTGTFASMPRYALIVFPIYVTLAYIKNIAMRVSILIIFLILLTISTALFTQGYWVA